MRPYDIEIAAQFVGSWPRWGQITFVVGCLTVFGGLISFGLWHDAKYPYSAPRVVREVNLGKVIDARDTSSAGGFLNPSHLQMDIRTESAYVPVWPCGPIPLGVDATIHYYDKEKGPYLTFAGTDKQCTVLGR